MTSWEATGPPVMVCVPPASVVDVGAGGEVLDHAQPRPARSRRRPRSAAGCAAMPRTRSTQKLPSRSVLRAGEAADQRDRDRHADRGGDEVLHGQAGHLHQVAHRRLTGVRLPVGVGDEADRGVPRQRRRHRRRGIAEVQRQLALQPLEHVQEQDADRREREHAAGVDAPALLGCRVDPDQPVDHPLDARVLVGAVRPGTCSRRAARARRPARRSGARGTGSPPSWYSLEPLREEQRASQKQRGQTASTRPTMFS